MTRGRLILFALSCLGFAILIWSFTMNTAPRKPLHIKVQLMETGAAFLTRNAAPDFLARATDPEKGDSSIYISVSRAAERYTEDPSEITLTYDAPGCPITFPAGRQQQVSFEGPFVVGTYLIYPMEPMTWDEMQAMVAQTVDLFEKAGWPVKPKPEFGPPTVIRRNVTVAQFNETTSGTKTVIIGTWTPCNAPNVEVYAEVRHLNSAPSGPSIPPLAATTPDDPDAPDRFVMLVDARITDAALADEIMRLRNARRMAEHGNDSDPVPLSRWTDDPSWRPENWNGVLIK
jgi:hypothetical protein